MKKLLCGLLAGIIIGTGTSVFAYNTQVIEAVFGKVNLVVNGNAVDKETLLYNGTTYVPLRAAGEALGMAVTYDAQTSTAYIGSANVVQGNIAPVQEETEVTEEDKMSLAEYNEKKESINNEYENLISNAQNDLSVLGNQMSSVQSTYQAISYEDEIAELKEEASHYSNAGTLAGQDYYQKLLADIDYYTNLQNASDAELEAAELQYKQAKENIESQIEEYERQRDKELAALEEEWQSQN